MFFVFFNGNGLHTSVIVQKRNSALFLARWQTLFEHQKLHTGQKTLIWKKKKDKKERAWFRWALGCAMKWPFGFVLISNIIIHWCQDHDLFSNPPYVHVAHLVDATSRTTSIIKPIKTDIPGRVRRKDPILKIWANSLLQLNRIKRIKYSSLHIYTAVLWLCIHL